MAVNLYNKKTIKSGVFLFPILGTNRYTSFPHERTYIICEKMGIVETDKKLIVSYMKMEDKRFLDYERTILTSNPFYVSHSTVGDETYYIFNLTKVANDWKLFLEGRYSKFSPETKKRIMAYHAIVENRVKKDNRVIQEILYPLNPTMTEQNGKKIEFQDAFERYAPSLGITPQMMREIGEIYSKPDLKNEVLVLE
jgi:hypothetical protein